MSRSRIAMMSAMMQGGSEPDVYENCITFDFGLSESVSLQITGTKANSYMSKLIVDGEEVTISNSKSVTFDSGNHKIGWLMTNTSKIEDNVVGSVKTSQNGGKFTKATVTVPACVETMTTYALRDKPAYYPWICYVLATTPPAISASSIGLWGNSDTRPIYVPQGSVDSYKAATGWSQFSSAIKAIT